MALPAFTKELVKVRLDQFCDQRVPKQYRNELRLTYKFRGDTVTLFEERPAFRKPEEWVQITVAQFRYDGERNEWTLYWADRNNRWHLYDVLAPNADFDVLLKEVNQDPTGIFWG